MDGEEIRKRLAELETAPQDRHRETIAIYFSVVEEAGIALDDASAWVEENGGFDREVQIRTPTRLQAGKLVAPPPPDPERFFVIPIEALAAPK